MYVIVINKKMNSQVFVVLEARCWSFNIPASVCNYRLLFSPNPNLVVASYLCHIPSYSSVIGVSSLVFDWIVIIFMYKCCINTAFIRVQNPFEFFFKFALVQHLHRTLDLEFLCTSMDKFNIYFSSLLIFVVIIFSMKNKISTFL